MTDMVVLPSSLLLSNLSQFLANPVIKIETCSSEEIVVLQEQLKALQAEHEKLLSEHNLLVAKYGSEVHLNLRMQDLFRKNGIKWR